jgi:hypothetical protein
MNIQGLLSELAVLLNDNEKGYEFSRYSKTTLAVLIKDALQLFASRRPDLFTEFAKVKLRPGHLQDARPSLSNVFDVVAQLDECDNVITSLSGAKPEAGVAAISVWDKPSVLTRPGQPFILSSAKIDNTLNGRFVVQPAVPPKCDVWLLVKGYKVPMFDPTRAETDDFTLDGPEEIWLIIKWYVLAQCAYMDRDIQSMRVYLQTFAQLIGVAETGERYFESTDGGSKAPVFH